MISNQGKLMHEDVIIMLPWPNKLSSIKEYSLDKETYEINSFLKFSIYKLMIKLNLL